MLPDYTGENLKASLLPVKFMFAIFPAIPSTFSFCFIYNME